MTVRLVPLLAVLLLLPASDGRGQHQDLPVSSPGDRSSLPFPSYYEEAGRGRHWYRDHTTATGRGDAGRPSGSPTSSGAGAAHAPRNPQTTR